ncbi:MAG: T9SS type A sorting domain-containing protein [Ignavibacteria bacterium]|nr:T9SS type A sorting domain-containing protein [Ignavibacteria bacterium]
MLVNQQQPAGNYEAKFDASNLSSGVYLYKLQTGSYNKTMKMILMK